MTGCPKEAIADSTVAAHTLSLEEWAQVPFTRMTDQPLNLLEQKPIRNLEWETSGDGFVILLVPRFRHPLLIRWILPLLPSSPYIRVRLDALGSLVWQLCDGKTSVNRICERLGEENGGDSDSWTVRLAEFLRKMERDGFLLVRPVGD